MTDTPETPKGTPEEAPAQKAMPQANGASKSEPVKPVVKREIPQEPKKKAAPAGASPLAATPLVKDPLPKEEKKNRTGKLWFWLKAFGVLTAIGAVIGIGVLIYAAIYVAGLQDELPEYTQLAEYEPAVTTRVHAGNGTLVAEFARERRLFVPVHAIPDNVKNAFLSAEDKGFYEHSGLDYKGMIRANINNISNIMNDRALEGGSTITQQVAKNFLLTSEQRIERKVKEMLIARRMEKAFTKDHILELYLNEIYLGNRSYGVAAAALNYFEKPLDDLSVSEAAYLATLAKAPSNYHPIYNADRAVARRNWIINRMMEDGHITAEAATAAQETELGAVIAPPLGARTADTEYFAEEVRRQIVAQYGVEALYDGGLSVRSTLDPRLQEAAQIAFRKGLVVYDQRHGWRGPVAEVDMPADLSETVEGEQLREGESPSFVWQKALVDQIKELERTNMMAEDLAPWQLAVVLSSNASKARVGFNDGTQGEIPLIAAAWAKPYVDVNTVGDEVTDLSTVIQKGDIIFVEPWTPGEGETAPSSDVDLYALRQVPAVNGGLVAMDPHTGRVLAMVGGFSFGLSEFNRATQASRQPGSTFKPFVYMAAMDNGYTPSSIVLDAPFVAPSLGDNWWKPGNYVAGRFYGESTLRLGIEKSRNTMTARLAQDIGIDMIISYAKRFGVADGLRRDLSISLGAGEVTLMDLVSGYAMMVNGGRKIEPVLIDRIQDRYGASTYKRDLRSCENCMNVSWDGQTEPYVPDTREQVIDPRTAYQMVSILEGVVKTGTGASVGQTVDKPLAGKTGTTNDYKDAWFVGFSPDLVAGIYVGFDMPATLGQGEGGGIVAAPIFGEFMKEAIGNEPAVPFRVPSGIRLVRVNAKTGKPATPGEGNVILEAFKAEDDIYGTSSFSINGISVEDGNTDEGIDDDLGGLY
jgi:penicillin-binding protein 1A